MKFLLKIPVVLLFCSIVPFSAAQFQFQEESDSAPAGQGKFGPQLGASESQIWQTGILIHPGSQMENVTVTIPIPMEWPEQQILGINETKIDAALSSNIRYRTVNDGAREMILELNKMRPHRPVEIVVEIDLLNYELLPPDNPEEYYVIPKRASREVQQYLKESPKIECEKHRKLFSSMYHEITRDKPTDWEKVEAVYRFVQDNVKYNDEGRAREAKGALALTQMEKGSWEGDCKDMCCLFIAICRAGKVPARMVRVPEHCYAEFYLELKEGLGSETAPENGASRKAKVPPGFWFPCQVAGTYAFGGVPERRPILQKGDSYPDPDHRPRGRKMFLSECFEGSLAQGSPRPKFEWVHKVKGK